MSCGAVELESLDDNPEDSLLDLGACSYEENDAPFAYAIWSDVFGRYRRGNKLYHYIRKNFKRSEIVRTKSARNPNSGNTIAVYVWRIPNKRFKKWWQEKKPDPHYYADGYDYEKYDEYGYRY